MAPTTPSNEPIAIVGLGCRFPGAPNPRAFWQLLLNGHESVGEIPRDRFDTDRLFDPTPATPGRIATHRGGFLEEIDRFDAQAFGLSPREAVRLDPQQRLLLETAWHALEDAGHVWSSATARTGVFVGLWVNEYESRLFRQQDAIDFYMTLGSGRYNAAGRLSHFFGFEGPSLTIDTACSSSLVAVHLACQSLRGDECDAALAGGANVMLEPFITIAYSQARMMAPDGRCKFGDANGDGYVRSEGAGVVVLKRLSRALADGDRIYALIRGSGVNSDGASHKSLGAPSQVGQEAMLVRAYANAGVNPAEISYVEAHGTGTRAGDPVELGALAAVLGPGRADGSTCLVGSVKTNIGHTEAAAGVAGLIKAALAMANETIPASLHFHTPNPAIDWGHVPFRIPSASIAWPAGPRPRYAGVTAFGISGTNAHVVLQDCPRVSQPDRADASHLSPEPHLLPLSAHHAAALQRFEASVAERLMAQDEHQFSDDPLLADICYTASVRRTHRTHRCAVVATSAVACARGLTNAECESSAGTVVRGVADVERRKIVLVFSGQGSQWLGMGRTLFLHEPVFREAMERCDAAIRAEAGWSPIEVLHADPTASRLGEIDVVQPALFAMSVALAALWQSWGVSADAVVGHSMGEVAAAHVAGVLTLEDATAVIVRRSRLLRRVSGRGAMAVIDVPDVDVPSVIAGFDDRVALAVSNGPQTSVVSGDRQTIDAIIDRLESQGHFCRRVNVDVASHSPQMDSLLPDLRTSLESVRPQRGTIPLYSTVTATSIDGTTMDAEYWGRNLRQPVLFGRALTALLRDQHMTFVEMSPHPLLISAVQDAARAEHRESVVAVGSTRRDEDERRAMLEALAQVYVRGHDVAWQALYPNGGQVVSLPPYCWQRDRYWYDNPESSALEPSATATRFPVMPLDERMRGAVLAHEWASTPVDDVRRRRTRWVIVSPIDPVATSLATALHAEAATVDIVPSLDGLFNTPAIDAMSSVDIVMLVQPAEPSPAAVALAELQDLQRALTAVGSLRSPRVWWVTRGAYALNGHPPGPNGPAQASVWGAVRVFAHEHPECWGGVIDLAAEPREADIVLLARHLNAADAEDQVALRDGARYALRLVGVSADAFREAAAPPWRQDASYLITGGLGGIALNIAMTMVQEGARRLVLVGRTPLPPRQVWMNEPPTTPVGRRIVAVRALEHAGAAVHVMCADVTDETQLRAALDAFHAEGWPPIRGAIHAAGVLDSHLAHDMTREAFDRVMAPKLTAAIVLDRLLPELDLFVLFSSMMAFWGAPGLSNYGAANAGLDALAAVRRGRGQHALSIQWGPWAGTGLWDAEIAARNEDELAGIGVATIASAQGAAVFSSLLARPESVLAVVPIDWDTFASSPRVRDWPLFRNLVQGTAHNSGAVEDDLPSRLEGATPVARLAIIEGVVRETLGSILRYPAAQLDMRRVFGAMGLDSLMALELRNRLTTLLHRPLPATIAWNYPTIAQLAAHLESLYAPAPTGEPEPAAAELLVDELALGSVQDLESLSEEDAFRALRGQR